MPPSLEAKLAAPGVNALLADFDAVGDDPELRLVEGAEDKGEVCLYEALVLHRKQSGQYPTSQDLRRQLRSGVRSRAKCQYFDSRRGCTIRQRQVDAPLAFLEKRDIVKKKSVDQWWVSL